MSTPRFPLYSGSRGVTLIELTVAVVLSTFVAASVFFTWNHLNRYTAVQKHRTALQAESNRIVNQITAQLRRSEHIIRFDRSSLEFTVNNPVDTISYVLTNRALNCNGTPLSYTVPGIAVDDFSIENTNSAQENESYLFNIALRLVHFSGDTASATATVFVKRHPETVDGDAFGW